jgi:hypothetical protein
MSRRIQQAIHEELHTEDAAPEGEVCFTWNFGDAVIPGSRLGVVVDVRKISQNIGQAWRVKLSHF